MSCCGKKIADELAAPKPVVQNKSPLSKVKSIVTGNWNLVLRQLKEIPEDKCDEYTIRLGICRGCEFHTWLTWREIYRYINDNGGLIKFVQEIASLEDWPWLPKKEYASKSKLFCQKCKCFLMAKAASEDEACPLNKWKNSDVKDSSNG